METTHSLQSIDQCMYWQISYIYLPTATTVSVYLRTYTVDTLIQIALQLLLKKAQPYRQGCMQGRAGGVQAVTAKRTSKIYYIEKQERKKQLSGYKQCYTYKQKSKLRSVQIYEFDSHYLQQTLWLHCT